MVTRFLCNSSQYVAAASLYKNPGYDPFKDFAPIINAGVSPNMIFVHPSVPANNLQELIALGKKQKAFVRLGGRGQHAASDGRAAAETDGGTRDYAHSIQQRRTRHACGRCWAGADRTDCDAADGAAD